MPSTPAERTLRASIAAHESWAHTTDPTARTAPAREAFRRRFLDAAGGDPVKAEHLRKAHFQRLALASARTRRLAKEAAAAEAELAAAVALDEAAS